MTLFYYLYFLCLFLNLSLIQSNNSCFLLNNKLNKYHIYINSPSNNLPTLRVCQNANQQCCPQIYEDQFQNATAIELYQLFELSTINIYESVTRVNQDLNTTYEKLINHSRNETHTILERVYNKLYQSYRLSIDQFFNHLLTLTSRTYEHEIKIFIDQLFRQILHISLTLSNNQTISSNYFACLWKNHPFASNPNVLEQQLELNLGKIFRLIDLFKLTHEFVQILSTSVTTDYHCIDSYLQLSYCNLCSGRTELPCLSNCINIVESCLVNLTLIDQTWLNFLDSIENIDYFNNIEKVLSSIGLTISDAVMNFFNSGGVQNKDIIDQCGHRRSRRQTFSFDQKSSDQSIRTLSLSLLDEQLVSINQIFKTYRSFWRKLPKDICQLRGITARNGTKCWTGTSVSEDGRSSIRTTYDKPLNLKLQWIIKEIKQKSEVLGKNYQTTIGLAMNLKTSTLPNVIIQHFNETSKSSDLDDYPNDNESDYSDYGYDDSTDEVSTTTTTTTTTTITATTSTATTRRTTTTPLDEEIPIDDTNTAYYDYGDNDVYSDDESDESTTTEQSIVILTTNRYFPTTTNKNWKERIPYYHRRPAIIWNVNNFEKQEEQQQQSNSGLTLHYSFFFIIIISIIALTIGV